MCNYKAFSQITIDRNVSKDTFLVKRLTISLNVAAQGVKV